jgi:dihydrofolate reductase
MGKVIYSMSVSLDGFIETPDGDISWSFPDDEIHQYFNDQERAIDTFLYGRRLYEYMAAFWPTADENPLATKLEIEYAYIWKNKPKIVFSTTLIQVGWNARLVSGDIAGEVNKLKEQPGINMSVGGADLASTFMQLGLIDEYCLYVHPVILGSGKPMFRQLSEKILLRFVETRKFGNGVVLLRYQRK